MTTRVSVRQSNESCLLPNVRQALLCSSKIHHKQRRLEAPVWEAGHHPDNNTQKIPKKAGFLPFWQMLQDLKLEIIFGNGAATERDIDFKGAPVNIVGNCQLCFFGTQEMRN